MPRLLRFALVLMQIFGDRKALGIAKLLRKTAQQLSLQVPIHFIGCVQIRKVWLRELLNPWVVSLLFVAIACGCAPLAPRAIEPGRYYTSTRLITEQPQIERGTPRPVIDAVGWVVGIPEKILLWDRRVSNHRISQKTEQSIAEYLDLNDLRSTKVRLNQYRPLDDWRRLIRNDSVGPLWRCTFGTISVLGETLIPGRVFGADHYNPYTDTIHLYSDVPAIALHEGGHAKDFARRKWKGTYAFCYILPVVPLYHESIASSDVIAYLEAYGSPDEQASAAKILYPAYGTYVGNAAGSFFPSYSIPIYYGSLVSGHVLGRYRAREIELASSRANRISSDYPQVTSPEIIE